MTIKQASNVFYNKEDGESKLKVDWHDYISIVFMNIQLVIVRRYDWKSEKISALSICFLGFVLFERIWNWKES